MFDYLKKDQVIDILLVVDDTHEFHRKNMEINQKHYSFFTKRLPLAFTNAVNNSGSFIYFNPLIPIKSFKDSDELGVERSLANDLRKLKYGVIS